MPSLFRQLLKPVEMAEHDAPSMPQRERHDTPPDSKHETQQRAVSARTASAVAGGRWLHARIGQR